MNPTTWHMVTICITKAAVTSRRVVDILLRTISIINSNHILISLNLIPTCKCLLLRRHLKVPVEMDLL